MNNPGEEDAPRVPHLAIKTKTGHLIAIKPGTVMAIVEDPKRVDGIFYLVLRAVNHRHIDFDTLSSDERNTRRVRFRADWKGKYESPVRDAVKG